MNNDKIFGFRNNFIARFANNVAIEVDVVLNIVIFVEAAP